MAFLRFSVPAQVMENNYACSVSIATEQQNKRGYLPFQSLQLGSAEGYRHHLGEPSVSVSQGRQ